MTFARAALVLSASFLLGAGEVEAGRAAIHAVIGDDAINAVIGDASWIERHGVPPAADAGELERITTHLAHVERRLRAQEPPSLTRAQRSQRRQLLDALADYRRAGIFPHNDARTTRTPRFIDPDGRACAVAYLMHASGEAALARALNEGHEWSYVRQIHDPALDRWAAAHGFTRGELAMIQPAYGPPRPWPRPGRVALNMVLAAVKPQAEACVRAAGQPHDSVLITINVDWPLRASPHATVTTRPARDAAAACVTQHVNALLKKRFGLPRFAQGPAVQTRLHLRVQSKPPSPITK